MADTEMKLERANTLISMFTSEQHRWKQIAKDIDKSLERLWGDCLLAAGISLIL